MNNTETKLSRRSFLGASTALALSSQIFANTPDKVKQHVLPRWRGFNLQPFFGSWNNGEAVEDDFRMIADLGFNFVRLPLWYTHWADPNDWLKVREPVLEKIDEAVEYARKYNLHISLNFHRAPGYCVAKEPPEPFDLFKDQEALDAFCFHWNLFAKRYAGIDAKELSFNLVNEPIAKREDHERVVRAVVASIRSESPDRLIIADGLVWGQLPMPELEDLGIAQSTRGYAPSSISHYKASWVKGADLFPEPAWPSMKDDKINYDREKLENLYAPWGKLAADGVGVHCGECGCFNQTQHPVFLDWFEDVLGILTGYNIGYALWEFRGSFGILDSGRGDVRYEDWHGHKLDRKLLDLLQAH